MPPLPDMDPSELLRRFAGPLHPGILAQQFSVADIKQMVEETRLFHLAPQPVPTTLCTLCHEGTLIVDQGLCTVCGSRVLEPWEMRPIHLNVGRILQDLASSLCQKTTEAKALSRPHASLWSLGRQVRKGSPRHWYFLHQDDDGWPEIGAQLQQTGSPAYSVVLTPLDLTEVRAHLPEEITVIPTQPVLRRSRTGRFVLEGLDAHLAFVVENPGEDLPPTSLLPLMQGHKVQVDGRVIPLAKRQVWLFRQLFKTSYFRQLREDLEQLNDFPKLTPSDLFKGRSDVLKAFLEYNREEFRIKEAFHDEARTIKKRWFP